MLEKNIFAGFGGQGVLLMGQLLAKAGMDEDKFTSWIPSYGPEMRGGTANCSVIISDREIASPIVTVASSVIAMNRPSMEKFESVLQPGGKLFLNQSIIDVAPTRSDIEIFSIPASDIANELGNSRVTNMVMLGAYLQRCNVVALESVLQALLDKLGEKKAHLIPLNREALARGAACVK